MELIGAVLSGFLLALAAPWISRVSGRAAGFVLALLPLGLTVHFAGLLQRVARGQVVTESHAWVPSLGVSLSFRADGWSLLFALVISAVGALVAVFAGAYLAGHPLRGRFYAYLLVFMASMLGLALADNLIVLYVFWELTSLCSYFLIGFYHEDASSRAAAWQALLVTSAGGLCLLAGFLLLGMAGQSLEMATLLERGELVRAHRLYAPSLVLIGIGAATKSAQFPFHFWLPAAMAAPAPVSAYLHSATMVKAGVYLLARLHPVLGGTELWRDGVTGVGAVTMLTGAYLAWIQTDLKRILAYSTVSALGTLVMLIGLGSETAIVAAAVYFVAHAAYKGALFLVTGSVDHETGTRDVTRLSGLRRAMPVSAAAAVLAALSMAGLPPLLGFFAKELLIEATLGALVLVAAALATGVMTVIAAGLAAVKPFFGRPGSPGAPHEAPLGMWLGPVVLAAAGLLLGVFSGGVDGALIAPAAAAILGRPVHAELSTLHALSLWHGDELNVVLILGLATLLAGALAYALHRPLRRAVQPLDAVLQWGPARWYDWALEGMLAVARLQTRLLQSGYLRHYLLITIITTVALVGAALRVALGSLSWSWHPDIRFHEGVLAAVIIAAAAVVALTRSRFAAVTALGVVGYAVALIFVLFGAPDLAMTQFTTETLTVILLLLVLYRGPRFVPLSSVAARARDGLVAVASGGLMTLLVLTVSAEPTLSRLTRYYAENSVPEGHGHNVVNVILVDFRALDTLGEITVLAVAAIGGYALMKLRPAEDR